MVMLASLSHRLVKHWRRVARVAVLGSFAMGAPSCGGDSDGEVCGLLRASKPNQLGCGTPILELGPHMCLEQADAACEASDLDPECAASALTDCATAYYLRDYAPSTPPDCDPSRHQLIIDRDLELSLFRGARISDSNTVKHTKGLQRYFAPHELRMTTRDIAESDSVRFAMEGTAAQFNQALFLDGLNDSVFFNILIRDTFHSHDAGFVFLVNLNHAF